MIPTDEISCPLEHDTFHSYLFRRSMNDKGSFGQIRGARDLQNKAYAASVKVENLNEIVKASTADLHLSSEIVRNRGQKVAEDLRNLTEVNSCIDKERWTQKDDNALYNDSNDLNDFKNDNHTIEEPEGNSCSDGYVPTINNDKAQLMESYPSLNGAMGNFCRVIVNFDSPSNKKVSCSCSTYMSTGTCEESRFFSLLTGIRYGNSACTQNIFPGWGHVSSKLQEKWAELSNSQTRALRAIEDMQANSDSIIAELYCEHGPPLNNPRF